MDNASAELLSEHAYAVVEGTDPDDAYRHGKLGDGWPLWAWANPTPVFRFALATDRRYPSSNGDPIRWMQAFFDSHDGWRAAEDVGIVLRFVEAKDRLVDSLDRLPGPRTQSLNDLILAALTEPDEPLVEDKQFGPWGLGDEPGFAAVCTRAAAMMHMSECPPEKLLMLELPKVRGHEQHRFLFFGWKKVV